MSKAVANTIPAVFAAVVALSATDAISGAWIQLCPAGTFSARDGRGPFEAGHGDALQVIVDRSKQIAGNTELVIDYDHQSVFGARDGVGGRAPAAGWVKDFQVRNDGIWGQVNWTAKASEAIQAQEYRYLSPVLIQSKATGKVLAIRMAALTNTPALDLAQVQAFSDAFSFDEQSEDGDPMDKVLQALGLAAGSTEAAALSAINQLKTSAATIAQAAGVAADAPADQVVAAFSAKSKTAPDPAQYVPLAAVTELQTTVKELQQALSADKAVGAVNKAIAEGKLTPGLKQWGLDYANSDLAGFEAYASGAPVLTAPQLKPAVERKPGDAPLLDASQNEAARALGINPADYAKTLADEAASAETL